MSQRAFHLKVTECTDYDGNKRKHLITLVAGAFKETDEDQGGSLDETEAGLVNSSSLMKSTRSASLSQPA